VDIIGVQKVVLATVVGIPFIGEHSHC